MVNFVEENRASYGVEPICAMLPIALATYYERRGRRLDPYKRPARVKRDEALVPEIQSVYDENQEVYVPSRSRPRPTSLPCGPRTLSRGGSRPTLRISSGSLI